MGSRRRRWLILSAALLVGCPQLLDDDFQVGVFVTDQGDGGQAGSTSTCPPFSGLAGACSDAAAGDGGAGGNSGAMPDAGDAGTLGSGSACPDCAACQNGVQDEGETGTDCGGLCRSCACTAGSFGAPEAVAIPGLPPATALFGPSLSADGATLFFSASSAGAQDLYASSRGDLGTVFNAANSSPFSTMTTAANETTPRVSSDGLRLYFTSDFSGPLATGAGDLYLSTRTSTAATFPIPTAIAGVNSAAPDSLDWISPDELRLYFSSSRALSPGGVNLWFSERGSRTAPFGPPRALSELNTEADDQGASLSPDQLTIYFSSNRTDAGSSGGFDIWMATREDVSLPFGQPALLADVNSSADDLDVSSSPDGTELFFSSDRAGAGHTLWRSVLRCP